jgi:hypothetical protein
MKRPVGGLFDGVALYAAITLWIPLLAATVHTPVWMARWVNRKGNGNPKFRLWNWPGRFPPKGCYLRLDIDPRIPIRRETILAGTRRICASAAVCAVGCTAALLAGWLILRQPWMFASACAFAALLAWEVYPRSNGIRYRTGILAPDAAVRSLCLAALTRALEGETPIQDWHPEYFRVIGVPSDGSIEEFNAASWIHTYALLSRDVQTATQQIERQLALIPEDMPLTQYIALGDALYFYTVVAADEHKSTLLLQQIRSINWDLRSREEYIEAAIALADGRRADALSITHARLEQIGSAGGTARSQLERELLTRCRDTASSLSTR